MLRVLFIPEDCPTCSSRTVSIAWNCSQTATNMLCGGCVDSVRRVPDRVCLICQPEWVEVHQLAIRDRELQTAKEDAVAAADLDKACQMRVSQVETRRRLNQMVDDLLIDAVQAAKGVKGSAWDAFGAAFPMLVSDCLQFCHRNRWSDAAITAIRTARIQAQQTNCEYVGTEHLLLALVDDVNSACVLLKHHHENADHKIAARIEELVGHMREPTPSCPRDDIPLTPRAANAVKTATDLASHDGEVGGGHILFALCQDADSAACQVLMSLSITSNDLPVTSRKTQNGG